MQQPNPLQCNVQPIIQLSCPLLQDPSRKNKTIILVSTILSNNYFTLCYKHWQSLCQSLLSKETIVLPLPRKTITVHSLTFPSPGKQVINNAQEIILPKAQAWWQNQNVRTKITYLFPGTSSALTVFSSGLLVAAATKKGSKHLKHGEVKWRKSPFFPTWIQDIES